MFEIIEPLVWVVALGLLILGTSIFLPLATIRFIQSFREKDAKNKKRLRKQGIIFILIPVVIYFLFVAQRKVFDFYFLSSTISENAKENNISKNEVKNIIRLFEKKAGNYPGYVYYIKKDNENLIEISTGSRGHCDLGAECLPNEYILYKLNNDWNLENVGKGFWDDFESWNKKVEIRSLQLDDSKWNIFNSKNYNYSIKFPENWQIKELDCDMDKKFCLEYKNNRYKKTKVKEDENMGIANSAIVYVLSYSVTSNITVDDFIKNTLNLKNSDDEDNKIFNIDLGMNNFRCKQVGNKDVWADRPETNCYFKNGDKIFWISKADVEKESLSDNFNEYFYKVLTKINFIK